MLVLEAKLKGKQQQYKALDEAIRTALFIRNKALRYWLDNRNVNRNDLSKQCRVLGSEYEWANKLNSMARQAAADRAWLAISRFLANCRANIPGQKGFPRFKKRGHSVEYKTTGWKLSPDRKYLTLTDGFEAGKFKLIGTRDLNFYSIKQIKRVRIVRRADGYYSQFCLDLERKEVHQSSGRQVGIDLGLEYFYTDSEGNTVENPRYLRKSQKSLKRLQRRVSQKKKGSSNRRKAINKLARKHLLVSRQRREFAGRTARALVKSSDLIAYELRQQGRSLDLKVRNLVKNHKLAKSISDASWRLFLEWLEYFAKVYGVVVRAVAPHYTSTDCSSCGNRVKKTLSTRTHQCIKCGLKLHRDHNAALMILAKSLGLNTVGQPGINAWGQNALCKDLATSLSKVTG